MSDFANPIPELAWVDSDSFERTFLMWQLSEDVGLLVLNEETDEEPVVVFLPFIDDPERAFWEGRDVRRAGVSLSRLKDIVARIEAKVEAAR